jgi:hypothetical protein
MSRDQFMRLCFKSFFMLLVVIYTKPISMPNKPVVLTNFWKSEKEKNLRYQLEIYCQAPHSAVKWSRMRLFPVVKFFWK